MKLTIENDSNQLIGGYKSMVRQKSSYKNNESKNKIALN